MPIVRTTHASYLAGEWGSSLQAHSAAIRTAFFSTLLVQDLSRRGFQTVSESAREVIAERLSQGVPPRPGHEAFARESLRRDEKKYQGIARDTGVIFFDQSPLGAMAMINEVAPMTERDLQAALTARGEGLSA